MSATFNFLFFDINPFYNQNDFGYAVTKMIFLNERPMSASSVGANLLSCNASGWVRIGVTHLKSREARCPNG